MCEYYKWDGYRMSDEIYNILKDINSHRLVKIILYSALFVWLCLEVYNLGKVIGEAVYYLSHPI
jgi:hypothetical protein